MKTPIIVGTLVETERKVIIRRNLTVNPGYGMICSGLGVTNGHVAVCAKLIKGAFNGLERARLESGDPELELVFTLEDEVLDVSNMTANTLFKRLLAVYEKYGE